MRRRKFDAECDDMARIDRRYRKRGQIIRTSGKSDKKRQEAFRVRTYSKARIEKFSAMFVRHTVHRLMRLIRVDGAYCMVPKMTRCQLARIERAKRLEESRLKRAEEDKIAAEKRRIINRSHRLLFYKGREVESVEKLLAYMDVESQADLTSARIATLSEAADKAESDKAATERNERARGIAETLVQEHALQLDGSVQIPPAAILALRKEHSDVFVKLVLSHLPYLTLSSLIGCLRRKIQEKQVSQMAETNVVAAEIPEGKEAQARLYVTGATPLNSEKAPVWEKKKPPSWVIQPMEVLKPKKPQAKNATTNSKGRFSVLTEDVGLATRFEPPIKIAPDENQELLNMCFGNALSTSVLREEIARKIFWLSLVTSADGEGNSKEKFYSKTNDSWRKKSPSPKNNVNNLSNSVSQNVSFTNAAAAASHSFPPTSAALPASSPPLATTISEKSDSPLAPPPLLPSISLPSFSLFTTPELPKNMTSLLIPVFSATRQFQLRTLNSDERLHARLTDRVKSNEPDMLADPPKLASSGVSLVQSMKQFEFNFDVFSYGMLRGVNLTRAVISGGAVLACLLPVSADLTKTCESYYAFREETMKALSILPNALSQLVDSYAMIGHDDWDVMASHYKYTQHPFWNSDIDIFVCAETEHDGLRAIASIAFAVASNIPSDIPRCFIRTTNAITVVSAYPYRHVQIILMLNRSVEEVLLGADMDCTSVGFTSATGSFLSVGAMPPSASPRQVVCLPRFMRAMNTKHNFIDLAKFSRPNMPCRLGKYFARGFSMLLFDICEHDLRCDVMVTKQVVNQLVAVKDTFSQADDEYGRRTRFRSNKEAYPDMQIPYGLSIDARAIAHTMTIGNLARREILKQWAHAPHGELLTVQEALIEFKLPWVIADHLEEVMPELGCAIPVKVGPAAAPLAERFSEEEREARIQLANERSGGGIGGRGGFDYGRRGGGRGGFSYGGRVRAQGYKRYEVGEIARDLTVNSDEEEQEEKEKEQKKEEEMLSREGDNSVELNLMEGRHDNRSKEQEVEVCESGAESSITRSNALSESDSSNTQPNVLEGSDSSTQPQRSGNESKQFEEKAAAAGGAEKVEEVEKTEAESKTKADEAVTEHKAQIENKAEIENSNQKSEELETEKEDRESKLFEATENKNKADKSESEEEEEAEEDRAKEKAEQRDGERATVWTDLYEAEEEESEEGQKHRKAIFEKYSKMPNPYLTKHGAFAPHKSELYNEYNVWERMRSPAETPHLTPSTKQPHKWGVTRMCPYEGLTHLPCVRFKRDELIRTGIANEFVPPCYVCLARFTPEGGMGGVRGALACRLCPDCVRVEEEKISARVDLRGRVGLVTGGRTKIGFAIALKTLRCGALVIVTTRFPQSALLRYKEQPDWDSFKSRLHVYGLDMRALPSVNEFLAHVLRFYPRLDFLINNAAQTVRRPPAYYKGLFDTERSVKLMAPEMKMVSENPFLERLTAPASVSGALTVHSVAGDLKAFGTAGDANSSQDLAHKLGVPLSHLSAALPLVPLLPSDAASESDAQVFPVGRTDRDGEPLDLRPATTWTSTIASVPLLEVMETQLVNSIVPFSFISTLTPLLSANAPLDLHTPKRCNRFVVNVSAREGQFGGKPEKLNTHPHTNMAKAALNMLTRTVAAEMAASKIFVTAVDTGWVSRMRPGQPSLRSVEPPLSNEAGAARVLDPIFSFLNHPSPPHGVFLQNYQIADW